MLKWLSEKKEKAKQAELERFKEWSRLQKEESEKEEQAKQKREEELRQAAKKLEEQKSQAIKESDEPWSDCVVCGTDENGRIKVELDWNNAFVRYLRECGFTGEDDQVVLKYWATLAREQWDDGKNKALNMLKEYPDSPIAKDAPQDKPE